MRIFLPCLCCVVVLAAWSGCKSIPDPAADEVTRVLRHFDTAQRPDNADLPIERYFAWAARRDAGVKAPEDIRAELRNIVDEQVALQKRTSRILTHSPDAQSILDAYREAHKEGHQAMEEVLAALRLGDTDRARSGDALVRRAMDKLRQARAHRDEVAVRMGLPRRARAGEGGAASK